MWQDKCLVYVMSTNCKPTGSDTVRRKQRDGSTTPVPCPPNVVVYNRYMGGVDHHDQFRSYYKLRLKSKKLYTYIFRFLLDACIINAFLMMRHFGAGTQSKLSEIKHFRIKLAERLIGNYNSRQKYSLPADIRAAAKHPHCTPPSFTQARRPSETASTVFQLGQGNFPVKGESSHYCWNYHNHRSSIHCQICSHAFYVVPIDSENGPTCFEQYHCRYIH